MRIESCNSKKLLASAALENYLTDKNYLKGNGFILNEIEINETVELDQNLNSLQQRFYILILILKNKSLQSNIGSCLQSILCHLVFLSTQKILQFILNQQL